jgi:transglutaminase-like putative cysteine protease
MPENSISRLLLTLCVLICISLSAKSSAPVVHLSAKPAWLKTYKDYNKKIPLRDVEKGYFYQLIEEQIQVELQADYRHNIREIVSDAGIQNGSEISVGFDPTYERLDFHEIIVWRDNKPINRLCAGSFKIVADEQELSKFIYQGSYTALCILNDIRKGDKIEYSYTITGRNPIFNNKFSESIYLQQSQPIAHLYKSIQALPARKLNFRSFNKVPKTIVSDYNGLKCYEWEDFQVQPATDYDAQPTWYTTYGYIQVSDFSSWKEVIDWGLKINPIATNISGNLAKQVADLKAGAGNNKEKYFRNAVKSVQDEVRYMGIELGQYSHRANDPEKVYDQRYGDCKDKSLLLASILNAGGIPANMVLVNADTRAKADQYLPSPFVFNHAVVVANINDKQVWIDPTISYQRGTGANLFFPDYGKGLILKPGSNGLTVIPRTKTGKIICQEKYTIPEKGKVKLDVITTYTLNEADKIRDRLASASMSETEKNYLNYYIKIYPKIEAADSVTVTDNEDENKLTTIEHYRIANFFKKDSATAINSASFYANYIDEQLPVVENNVKYPVSLYYPYAIDYTISVVLPSGWNVESQHTEIKRDAYAFSSDISAIGDMLLLKYKFNYLKDFIPVNKLDEYRADVKQLKNDNLSYTFTYSPGGSDTPFRLNIGMLIAAIILTLIIAIIGFKIYHTETHEILFASGANFIPLGGWLIVVAISLSLSILIVFISLFTNNYFDLNHFNAHLLNANNLSFKAFFTMEALGNIFMICYACFCLILLLNKRDILPKFIIGLYLFIIVFFVADAAAAYYITNGTVSSSAGSSILRSVIAAAIWIPYFKMSTRVEQTFIVPYPANNYKYEEMEAKNSNEI